MTNEFDIKKLLADCKKTTVVSPDDNNRFELSFIHFRFTHVYRLLCEEVKTHENMTRAQFTHLARTYYATTAHRLDVMGISNEEIYLTLNFHIRLLDALYRDVLLLLDKNDFPNNRDRIIQMLMGCYRNSMDANILVDTAYMDSEYRKVISEHSKKL